MVKQPKQKKTKDSVTIETAPLTLRAADDTDALTLPASVVQTYRRMVTRLADASRLAARLALVSALPEEGVSFSAVAVAATIAHDLRRRACVVELNWHHPGVLKFAPNLASAGLAPVLDGVIGLDEALVTLTVDTQPLALLPAGELAAERRPVVARGTALQKLLDQLSGKFDHILLDVPAIKLSSDAIPLIALASGVILVVRQGVTPMTEVKRALDDIKSAPMLGVIMNRVNVSTPAFLRNILPPE